MNISRRHFLGGSAGCAATLWSFRSLALDKLGSAPEHEVACALIDLNSHCVLPESLQGYQAALQGEHHLLPESSLYSRSRCRIAIVPGLGVLGATVASTLSDLLAAGTHVLLESGAGFLSPAEFSSHQTMLHRHFDIAVDPPVDLWLEKPANDALLAHRPRQHQRRQLASRESVPYINYLWPRETKVRDFSRVIPVSGGAEDTIGKIGELPVALKKRISQGTLIFLGSPLGPSLRAGDSEAMDWLRLVVAS